MGSTDTPKMGYTPPADGFRTFVILWASQTLSVFGSQLTFFAMTVWLTITLYPLPSQQPLLAAALSAIALAFGLPNLLLAPVAGVLADRFDRKTIMFWANLACAAVTLVLLGLLFADELTLVRLILLQAAVSAFGCLHQSAFDASYAMLVPDHLLPRANGMMQTIFSLSGILSPAIAAALIALPALMRQLPEPGPLALAIGRLRDGAVFAIGVNSLTLLGAAMVLPFLSVPSPRMASTAVPAAPGQEQGRGGGGRSFWADVREGIAFIAARRGLLWLLLVFASANLLLAPGGVLQPMILRDNMGADFAARGLSYEAALALLGSVGAIGGLAGGLVVTAWGGLRSRRVYGVLVPMIACGLAQMAFGLSAWVYLGAGAVAVRAATGPLMNAHSQTIWQTETPREMQGRVFAVRRVIAQFTIPIGTAFAGLIGGRVNPGLAVAGPAALLVLLTVTQLFNRALLTAETAGAAAAAVAAPAQPAVTKTGSAPGG